MKDEEIQQNLTQLQQEGLPRLKAIVSLRENFDLSLGQAMSLVESHPGWHQTGPTSDQAQREWHGALIRHHDAVRAEQRDVNLSLREPFETRSWTYEARHLVSEIPMMTKQFAQEREKKLAVIRQQCSISDPEPIKDNHLKCCLGVECRKCPELLALDSMQLPPEEIDGIKAWTCGTHIVSKGGDVAREGYLLTVDDRMFWERVYENMASGLEEEEP